MRKHDRWNALLEQLAADGQIDIDAAAGTLGVSSATIRRDLDELTEQQMVTRTRGGAVAYSVSYDLPLRYKTARHAPEKQRIAAAAAAMVDAGAIVGLTGGTTTTEVARALSTRAVTIVTNAVNIANELAVRPDVKIVMPGGVMRPQSYELIGPLASGVLGEISLDIAFLGVDGIDPERGVGAHHEGEAAINRLMAFNAARVVVVADASKLGRRTFARICELDRVHTLITDTTAPRDALDRLAAAGLAIVTV
ncbi:DeoR/GlpR family transcriptional regulator of sugar metabolism [Allocatelliglobosispora scoriae]|uniref:DeoR/GlpR family transcriptional regulator of sugar metabolism n=1 Tax=Allocatelliglobosispora scoriae TaxID=643052 RepID=A0A841BZE7_9ACTN|nr:DeoR/GlpR family DNA-binding transcription regulator [Allocatelliglobosispora scoriae]MBB5872469.1 DeoR/GlpR family transcriptional regulator of sugar metabolism [Allocatelliglobosispora scoriae]